MQKIQFGLVWAMVIRHIYQILNDRWRLINTFYWHILDIILMGYLSTWVQSDVSNKFGVMILVPIFFWNLVTRANFDVSWNMMEEIWSKHIPNLFSSPLNIYEWILSSFIFALISLSLVFSVLSLILFFVYDYNILVFGLNLIFILASIFIAGLTIGLLAASFLIYWGDRVTSLAFMLGWIFSIFSGAYYPIDILPNWIQKISYMLPFSYIFQSIRSILDNRMITISDIYFCLFINLIYLFAMCLFFRWMFEKSRSRGLSRVID